MEIEKTDFVLAVEKRFDSLAEPDIANKVFSQLYHSAVKDDDVETARITAKMLLGLAALGESIQDDAQKWCDFFGPMFQDPV